MKRATQDIPEKKHLDVRRFVPLIFRLPSLHNQEFKLQKSDPRKKKEKNGNPTHLSNRQLELEDASSLVKRIMES